MATAQTGRPAGTQNRLHTPLGRHLSLDSAESVAALPDLLAHLPAQRNAVSGSLNIHLYGEAAWQAVAALPEFNHLKTLFDAAHPWGSTRLWDKKNCLFLSRHPEQPHPDARSQDKPWFAPAAPSDAVPAEVVVIGAGIAGAATAFSLAQRGVRVRVLESIQAASGASGNRQGLMYANISPHPTLQSDLLLSGYAYVLSLLHQLLPHETFWHNCGVLHLDTDPAEAARHQALGQHGSVLYRYLSAPEAARTAGVALTCGGLYWPFGGWVHPPALVRALLNHPLIELHEFSPVSDCRYQDDHWQLTLPQGTLNATHLVICTGAAGADFPLTRSLPWRAIRGQTSVIAAGAQSSRLRTALSGRHYLTPAWQGAHTAGASFVFDDTATDWRSSEHAANLAGAQTLSPQFGDAFEQPQPFQGASVLVPGKAGIRSDSPDHLPVIGRLGDAAAMQRVYAKLALDKNYRLHDECPFLPNVWLNSAHGTRGLLSAPIGAEAVAADILGLPSPFSPTLSRALHPNRHIIRAIVRSGNRR